MNDFFNSIKFKMLIAILMVLIGFMVMSIYTGGTAILFSQIVSIITRPAQQFSANVSGSATSFFDRFLDAAETYDRNERMQEELTELREKLVDYDKYKHENEQLREILGLKEKRQDMSFEPASVIARDQAGRLYSFTIDKGTLNDVSYLDPVITPDGLVGFIAEVGLTSAKVTTILDATIDVGAYSSATRDIGIVTGTIDLAANGMCQIEYLPRDSEIAIGNIILTSGGNMYPKNLIIGTVEEVKPNAHGNSIVATIWPAVDVRAVKDVFVITSFEGQAARQEAETAQQSGDGDASP